MRGPHETLTRRAALDDGGRSGANTDGAYASRHRLRRSECADRRRHARSPTGARHAADERTERRSPIRLTHVRPGEHGRPRRRDSRIDRAPEPAEERDVDAADAETRVETTHHVAAWTRELVLDVRSLRARRGRHYNPRTGDRNANLQTVALVGSTGWCGYGQQGRDHRKTPRRAQRRHQTPFRRNAEVVAPMSRRPAARAANTSVISRSSLRLPSREPSSSYTRLSLSASGAEKNSPPDSFATCSSVSGFAGTRVIRL